VLFPHYLKDEAASPKNNGKKRDEASDDERGETWYQTGSLIFEIDGNHHDGSYDDKQQ